MNNLRINKIFIAILISGAIIFNNAIPVFASSAQQFEIIQQKSDSTSVSSDENKAKDIPTANKEVKNVKATSNIAYNFIYFLISKFIQGNPLYHSR